jgi:hypothetical protein
MRVNSFTTRWPFLRWLLTPVASVLGFVLALVLGLVAYVATDRWFPWEAFGFDGPWCPVFVWVNSALVCAFSALAAVLVVSFGTWTAPTRARWVPWAVYAIGAATAMVMAAPFGASFLRGESPAGSDGPRSLQWCSLGGVIVPAFGSLIAGAFTAFACARSERCNAAPAHPTDGS